MLEGDVVGRPVNVVLTDIEAYVTAAMLTALRTMYHHRVHLRRVVGEDGHQSHCFWSYYEVHGIEMKSLGRVRERTVVRLQKYHLSTKGYDTTTITKFGRQVVDKSYQ